MSVHSSGGDSRSWDSVGDTSIGDQIMAIGASAGGSQQNLQNVRPSGATATDTSSSHSSDAGSGPIIRSTSLSELLPRMDGQQRIHRNVSGTSDNRSVGSPMPGNTGSSCSDNQFMFHGMSRRSPSTVSSISGEYDFDLAMRETGSVRSTGSRLTTHSSVSSYPLMSRDSRREELCTVYVDPPGRRLYCALCRKVYKDPVITTCGHTFCRRCCRPADKCPIDNSPISIVVANLAVSDQVAELVVHCKYGCRLVEGSTDEYKADPDGCPYKGKVSQRRSHELHCDFALMPCPNSNNCPLVMKKHLDEHLKVCEQKQCPHSKYNCPFRGTQEQVNDHLQSCRYEMIKDFLSEVDDKIGRLQTAVRQKDEEIKFLRTMLANFTDRLNMLEKNYEFRMERLDESNSKLLREVGEYRNHLNHMSNEVQNIAARTGVARDITPFKCVGTFVGHDGPVWSLCTSGDLLYSGSSDSTIKVWGPVPTVWDPSTAYRCQRTLTGHTGIVLALTTWKDRLYSGGADNTIRVWRLDTFVQEATLHAHENPVCTLAASRNLLFSGSLKVIKVWDTAQNNVVKELAGQNHWVRALVATEKHLYAGSYQSIKIWELETFDQVHVVEVTGGSVYSLQVTKDLLVCGTYENSIHVWSLNSLDQLQKTTLSGHAGTVYSLVVIESNGQQRLFSASYDRTIRVWNLESMSCLQTLIRHQGSVSCLATMHSRLYSGAVDCSLKVWQ